MNKLDKNIKFVPINICVLTVSDTRNKTNDRSGDLLCSKILESKHKIYERKIIKDEILLIKECIISWTKKKDCGCNYYYRWDGFDWA